MKTAVVLLQLGGPDSREAIEPFLINFFNDKNIIRVPQPLRGFIAKKIAKKRSQKEAGESYEALGNKSPLLENTILQSNALESQLNQGTEREFKSFICMRYWHPMADEVAAQVKAYNPDDIVLLPLYPQFSTATTRSSIEDWEKAAAIQGLTQKTRTICCYPFDDGFIKASAMLVRDGYEKICAEAQEKEMKPPRVLFSAHGLPEFVVRDGDPYQWQCETSARLIAQAMGVNDLDWQICYQSRVGPLKWTGPSTEEALEDAAEDQVPVLIYPHAFVSEHVETLVEIEEEYREIAEELGVPLFQRVPTVMTQEVFITGLKDVVLKSLNRPDGMPLPDTGIRLCPSKFRRCPCKAA